MTPKNHSKITHFLKNSLQNLAFPDSRQLYWLWRSSLVGQHDSGFILPTVSLLLVMVGLVVGVLTYRSFERAKQVSGQERQAVLYNAATPAVDRAKLKLEYLFTEDNLPPLPSDVDLVTALSNDNFYTLPDETRIELDGITEDVNNNGVLDTDDKNCDGILDPGGDVNNNGTLHTEDLNKNCKLDTGDNAWVFTDSSGQKVIYSILASANGRSIDLNGDGDTKDTVNGIKEDQSAVSITSSDQTKAENLVVRNGPINLTGASTKPGCENVALSPIAGWSPSTSGNLLKAIQVHAVALNEDGNFATLEMQQDRQSTLGNKWAAWFRYDMELFPGPSFQWNGASHTASNYLLASNSNTTRFYLVSSPKSCVYTEDASEITMTELDDNGDGTSDFQAQFFVGKSNNNAGGNKIFVDPFVESGTPTPIEVNHNSGTQRDTVIDARKPADILADPVLILTEDISRSRNKTDRSNKKARDTSNWNTLSNPLLKSGRFVNSRQDKPFLDDTYRADDRWGPKPSYTDSLWIDEDTIDLDASTNKKNGTLDALKGEDRNSNGILDRRWNGEPISRSWPLTDERCPDASCVSLNRDGTAIGISATAQEEIALTRLLPEDPASEEDYGYDGYWERRAKAQGLRIIVGQRLELGNPDGWINEDTDGDNTIVGDTGEDTDNNQELDRDPLYPPPPEATPGADGIFDTTDDDTAGEAVLVDSALVASRKESAVDESSMSARNNEVRQWKASRDNLAAVQSTAIYHYLEEKGSYPVACLASTAHFGTSQAERDSRTFEYVDVDTNDDGIADAKKLDTDFLEGKGTNGMEFKVPFDGFTTATSKFFSGKTVSGPASKFEEEINDRNSPLRIALANLAYFAGDPAGAFPARQDTRDGNNANDAAAQLNLNITPFFTPLTGTSLIDQWVTYANDTLTQKYIGPVVHPYPYLTMWGDYSNLRRTIDILYTNEDWNFNGTKDAGEPDYDGDNRLDVIYANIAADEIQPGGTARSDWFPLSIADQTTLQASTCTLGMLAYNVNVKEEQYEVEEPPTPADRSVTLGSELEAFAQYVESQIGLGLSMSIDIASGDLTKIPDNDLLATPGNYLNTAVVTPDTPTCEVTAGSLAIDDDPTLARNQYESITLSQWLCSYVRSGTWVDGLAEEAEVEALLTQINTLLTSSAISDEELDNYNGDYFTSQRDRTNGFVPGLSFGVGINGVPFQLDLDPEILDTSNLDTDQAEALALLIHQRSELASRPQPQPYYPSLFYLFPTVTREHDGRFSSALSPSDRTNLLAAGGSQVLQTKVRLNVDGSRASGATSITLDNGSGANGLPLAVDARIQIVGSTKTYRIVAPITVNTSDTTYTISSALDSTIPDNAQVTLISGTSEPYVNPVTHPYIFARNIAGSSNTVGVNSIDFDKNGHIDTIFRPVEDGLGNCAAPGCVRSISGGDAANDVVDSTEDLGKFVTYLGIEPRDGTSSPSTTAEWKTPVSTSNASPRLRVNEVRMDTDKDGTYETADTEWYPAFMDSVMLNGRDMMAARNLDLDLDLMRRTQFTAADGTKDYWLPLPQLVPPPNVTLGGAIIYAFREDAVREDAIARPRTIAPNFDTWLDNWLTYMNNTINGGFPTGYPMNAATVHPSDSPVNPTNGISAKSVDFYPDPDRRPYGFRLFNGVDLRRHNGSNFLDNDLRGMSFITDNPLYTVGHFNPHLKASVTNPNPNTAAHRLEEFKTALADNWSNFYTRTDLQTATNCSSATPCFAGIGDTWRPVELIADAVTVLSETWAANARSGSKQNMDGYFAPGMMLDGTGGSFRALMTVTDEVRSWVRMNGEASNLPGHPSPIRISRRGFPLYCVGTNGLDVNAGNCSGATRRQQEYGRERVFNDHLNNPGTGFANNNPNSNRGYIGWNDGRTINGTSTTRISYVMVQGLVPSRFQQAYGGLHNFPRFNETWGHSLYIAGSMIQLNFSNYATGPFDQDAWEPTQQTTSSNELINFYSPPTRLWGYDPALQYAVAGPVARRFVTPGNRRSEFYRELASDDPYVTSLRCAKEPGKTDDPATPDILEDRADRNVPKSLCQ